jgi:hypothetical protein
VAPDSRSVYVLNVGTNSVATNVEQYTADPTTGTLSLKTPATVLAGLNPIWIALSPDGRSA